MAITVTVNFRTCDGVRIQVRRQAIAYELFIGFKLVIFRLCAHISYCRLPVHMVNTVNFRTL